MSFGIVAGAAVGLAGAAMSADAAGDAADMQAGAANNATALQEKMFNKQVELQEPWRQAGMGGLNRLSYLMGLSPTGYGGQGSTSPSSGGLETADQIRARLTGAYTKNIPAGVPTWQDANGGESGFGGGMVTAPASTTVDTVRLDRAVQAEMARQQRELKQFQAKGAAASKNDPLYGSLLDKFSMDDFEQDPGHQFRQEEGEKAWERLASANGRLFSGRAGKDFLRFNSGLASQEYGAAFDRFNVQNTNTFNRLASIAGVGQTAANQTGAAAANYGALAGGNMIGAGNAMAAGRVGSANAINGAIGQGVSAYQQHNMLNGSGFGGAQASFSQTPLGSSGFGTGLAYGNQDYGQFI